MANTATFSATATTSGATYTNQGSQISIKNTGATDIFLNVGKFINVVIHPNNTFNNVVDYTSFFIQSLNTTCGFDAVCTSDVLYKMTDIGGLAVQMLNKTGVASVKGTVVQADTVADNACKVAVVSSDMPIGIMYDDGVADGSLVWVVVSGIAQVLMKNTVASTRGYISFVSSTAGRVDQAATIPVAATHDMEIGHPIESVVGGTNVLAKHVLHFR